MQNNKIKLSFDMSGNFLSLEEDSNKIYSGSVASFEYIIDFTENLSVNDLVYISFIRPDSQKVSPLICERILDNRFRLLSTGEELDYEITSVEELIINVIIKTKDVITNVSSIKTQANVTVNVYPGAKFIPGIVDDSILSNLEEHLNNIEKYTVKKYNVKDIQSGSVPINYEENGIKESPAIYIGYNHNVYSYDWNIEDYREGNVVGNLFVFSEKTDENTLKQYEYLFVDQDIYVRDIIKQSINGITTTKAGKFYNISYANNTIIEGIKKLISEHNSSKDSHSDIRLSLTSLDSRVGKNESDITTNASNIQQNSLAISNLTTQVDSNSKLITDTRNNLANNYYTKNQTYTKEEVKSLLGTAAGFQFVIVEELPEKGDPTKIYLVPITPKNDIAKETVVDNYYNEYIWLAEEQRYENIGSTQIDLSDYYTKSQIDLLLQNKADNSTVDSLTEIVNSAVLTTKQSLTPEQQAQARFNIGAGSSGFDGDYNSLVNLPTLNTTNSTSQEINSSEKISGTINLHKIAKTGSFADLNNIPQASQSTAGLIKIATDQEAQSGTSETFAINPKQLKVAIDGLGTVFDLKGSVATPQDLPQSNNTIGDVWYVTSESVGYIWLNDGTTDRWEQLGLPVDLSSYITISSIVNSLISQEVDKPLSANQGYILKGLIDAEVQGRTNSDNNLQEQITSNAENLNNKAGLNEQNIFSNTNQFDGQVSLGEFAYVDILHITNPNGGPAGFSMTSDGKYLVFDFSQQGAFDGLNIKSGEFFIDGQQILPMFKNGNYVDVNKNSINSSFDKPLYVTAFFDNSVSSSINDNSGIEIRISPNSDMSGATKVARSSSTNGYPKFEFVCAVIPKGYYFYVEVWGDRDNQTIIKKYEIEGA